eukprot:gb/GECH01010277.1/.p1 GENE.gb/GECH01010277.1/~~gb/GECH01010277.1/.p1  ORF type:complete len:321 (+),score=44.02 gb/GECH01010277.1/:1-963(+)
MEIDILFKALGSGLFAGIVAVLATVAIERFGGIIGGVIGSAPSTVIPGSVGIALSLGYQFNWGFFIDDKFTSNSELGRDMFNAAFSVPIGMCINVAYLMTWQRLPSYLPPNWSKWMNLAVLLTSSFLVWLILTSIVIGIGRNLLNISAIWMGSVALGTQLIVGLASVIFKPPPAPRGSQKVSVLTLIARGSFAMTSISIAVLISKVSPAAAGLASTFPSIFLTTMLAVFLSQGASVSRGAAGPMMLGSVSVPIFALFFTVFLHLVGFSIWLCVILAYLASTTISTVPITVLLRYLAQRKHRSSSSASIPSGEEDYEYDGA